MSLLQQCHVSELAARGPKGLGLGHTLAHISLGERAQVRLDLVVELLIRSSISEQSPKSRHQDAQIMDHLYSLTSSLQIAAFCDRIVPGVIRGEAPEGDRSSSRASPESSRPRAPRQ